MCRLIAYAGHSLCVAELVTRPVHSLVNQSYHSTERSEPLNGDGFGVAWYHPELSERPALFREVTPAWNNENLRELARVLYSPCILAHIRAAPPGSPVYSLNCHPFVHESLSFMHNGVLAEFKNWRRALLSRLSDQAFHSVRGSTDSEHAFAVFLDKYRQLDSSVAPPNRMVRAMEMTIAELEDLKRESSVSDPSYMNFVVADGEHIVATRYCTTGAQPASLHYTTGRQLRCEEGRYKHSGMDSEPEEHDFVLIASEETTPGFQWETVPPNHLLLTGRNGFVEQREIRAP